MFSLGIRSILLLSVTLVLGCHSAGTLIYEQNSLNTGDTLQSQRILVQAPTGAVHAGSLEIAADGTVFASTGSQERSPSPSSKSLGRLPWLGGLLLVAGIVTFVIRIKLPFLPAELGIGLIVSGLLLMILPSAIEAYLGYVLLGLVGMAAVVTIYRLNRTSLRLRQLDPTDPTPNPEDTSEVSKS